MPRFVALLRAINVGGHVVKMDRLRRLFEEIGLGGVTTHIASGNVLFDAGRASAASLERRIEDALEAALGYEVATFLRSPSELAAAAAAEPFPGLDPATRYVGFLKEPLREEQARLVLGFATPTDDFAVLGREVHWRCRTPSSDSEFSGGRLEKTLRLRATFRNLTTVRKISSLLEAAGT